MAFADNYDFENLKNESETMVLEELGRQLDASTETICRCNDCINDMAAMALNQVKPLYRVSLLGTLYTARAMEEEEYATKLHEWVEYAIRRVKKNPSHDGTRNRSAD
jgi:competence protein ComFB